MNKYTGVCCPVCGKAFTDSDDIVVCPECGAPHHRDCYNELGSCVFFGRHERGFVWEDPDAPARPAPEPQRPPEGQPALYPPPGPAVPGAPPDYTRNFTPGAQGQAAPPPLAEALGIRIDDQIDGIPVKDYAQFIGPNAYYYLLRFKMLASGGSALMINFSAMIFCFLYYFHRKMYRIGAALLALFLLTVFPMLLMVYYMFPAVVAALPSILSGVGMPNIDMSAHTGLIMISNLMNMLYLVACLLSGFFANRLYFQHAKKQVTQLHERFAGRPDQELSMALSIRGRTSKLSVIAIVGALFLGYILYEVFLAMSYQSLL